MHNDGARSGPSRDAGDIVIADKHFHSRPGPQSWSFFVALPRGRCSWVRQAPPAAKCKGSHGTAVGLMLAGVPLRRNRNRGAAATHHCWLECPSLPPPSQVGGLHCLPLSRRPLVRGDCPGTLPPARHARRRSVLGAGPRWGDKCRRAGWGKRLILTRWFARIGRFALRAASHRGGFAV